MRDFGVVERIELFYLLHRGFDGRFYRRSSMGFSKNWGGPGSTRGRKPEVSLPSSWSLCGPPFE